MLTVEPKKELPCDLHYNNYVTSYSWLRSAHGRDYVAICSYSVFNDVVGYTCVKNTNNYRIKPITPAICLS